MPRKNPLADLLGRLLAARRRGGPEFEVALAWRGAPDNRRVVTGAEIARAGGPALGLADGAELPLHRVLEVRSAGRMLWQRRRRDGAPPSTGD